MKNALYVLLMVLAFATPLISAAESLFSQLDARSLRDQFVSGLENDADAFEKAMGLDNDFFLERLKDGRPRIPSWAIRNRIRAELKAAPKMDLKSCPAPRAIPDYDKEPGMQTLTSIEIFSDERSHSSGKVSVKRVFLEKFGSPHKKVENTESVPEWMLPWPATLASVQIFIYPGRFTNRLVSIVCAFKSEDQKQPRLKLSFIPSNSGRWRVYDPVFSPDRW